MGLQLKFDIVLHDMTDCAMEKKSNSVDFLLRKRRRKPPRFQPNQGGTLGLVYCFLHFSLCCIITFLSLYCMLLYIMVYHTIVYSVLCRSSLQCFILYYNIVLYILYYIVLYYNDVLYVCLVFHCFF